MSEIPIVYQNAVSLLKKTKSTDKLALKDECRKFDCNSKDRKKIVSLVANYLNYKDDIEAFKSTNKIKAGKKKICEDLLDLVLTEVLYSRCYKPEFFKNWEVMSYLNKFEKAIAEKKKTIVLDELPKPIPKEEKKKRKLAESANNIENKNTGQNGNNMKNNFSDDNLAPTTQKKKQKTLSKWKNVDLFADAKEIPVKYVRVNRIKMSMDQLVTDMINKFNYIQVGRNFDDFNGFLKKLFKLNPDEFMQDYHFPDDLIIINKENKSVFLEYDMYQDGKIIFQDKASLISLKCAELYPGMKIADICCAPGTKTAAIASMLNNQCEMISIDNSTERLNSMRELMDKLGVNCTKILESDFTKTTEADFKFTKKSTKKKENNEQGEIDVLFLDPSCSGSGMVDKRSEQYSEEQEDRKRLMKLASFQTKLLVHAMSLRPKLIVYSTCSFSVWENEFVVCKALEQADNGGEYELVESFEDWPQRGNKRFSCNRYVIRAGPNRGTRGYFCAVFRRM